MHFKLKLKLPKYKQRNIRLHQQQEQMVKPEDELGQVENWGKAEFSVPEKISSISWRFKEKKISNVYLFDSISPHLFGEVEENGELPAAWQLGARLAQFVEECVRARLRLNIHYLFVAMIWNKTCRGVILADGVYSNNRDTRSIASGEVRARNTFKIQGLI